MVEDKKGSNERKDEMERELGRRREIQEERYFMKVIINGNEVARTAKYPL